MTTSAAAEMLTFGMHPNLLYDVITKQAGTLQKAILEGVMNGVDAGAERIDVTIDTDTVTVRDDGKGFASREEIEKFFKTFGTPHEEGDATYGRFRMGRGQMFAFGVNRWRTNVFQMDVDIKTKGLDFHLQDLPEAVKGCQIEIKLYDRLLPSECDAIQRDLKGWVAYVTTPVYLNGKIISEDPAKAKWDVETDDAWFKLAPSKNSLSVYNLGVLVNNIPAHRFGTGGVVVSKKRLDVNFARNDVQNTCPVFGKIKAELRRHSDKEVTRKKRITDHEREHLANRILENSIDAATAIDLPVITDVEGRHHSLQGLMRMLGNSPKLFAAARGNRQAITVTQQHLGTAIGQETLERFDAADIGEFLQKLRDAVSAWTTHRNWQVSRLHHALEVAVAVDLSDFDAYVSSSYEPIPHKKLNARQRSLRSVLEAGMHPIAQATGQRHRTVSLGHSEVAQAWTDGVTTVWFNVNMLPLLAQGYEGCVRLAGIMLHEFMHEGPDTDTHEHDGDFYKRHHDLSLDTDAIGRSVAAMMRYLAYDMRKKGRTPGQKVALFEDMEARVINEGGVGSSRMEIEELVDASNAELERIESEAVPEKAQKIEKTQKVEKAQKADKPVAAKPTGRRPQPSVEPQSAAAPGKTGGSSRKAAPKDDQPFLDLVDMAQAA